jgi:hypothetical protein
MLTVASHVLFVDFPLARCSELLLELVPAHLLEDLTDGLRPRLSLR